MNKTNLGAIATAFAIVFSANAIAATEAPKDASRAAESKPMKDKPATAAKSESAGEFVDDTVITTKVKAAVFEDASLKSAEINVETFKGIVQLTGFVKSAGDIKKAVALARAVKGVVSVKNDMIVKGKQ
jgi:osmotically-inducible protein OsmY